MRLTSVSTAAVTVTVAAVTEAGAQEARRAGDAAEAPTPRRQRVLLHHAAYF